MALVPAGMANNNIPIFEPNTTTKIARTNYDPTNPANTIIPNVIFTKTPAILNIYADPDVKKYLLVDILIDLEAPMGVIPDAPDIYSITMTGNNDLSDFYNLSTKQQPPWTIDNGICTTFIQMSGIIIIQKPAEPVPPLNQWVSIGIFRNGNPANIVGLRRITSKIKLLDAVILSDDPLPPQLNGDNLPIPIPLIP